MSSVKTQILEALEKNGEVKTRDIVSSTGFTRSYVNRFLRQLQDEGKIRLVGNANQAKYVVIDSFARSPSVISVSNEVTGLFSDQAGYLSADSTPVPTPLLPKRDYTITSPTVDESVSETVRKAAASGKLDKMTIEQIDLSYLSLEKIEQRYAKVHGRVRAVSALLVTLVIVGAASLGLAGYFLRHRLAILSRDLNNKTNQLAQGVNSLRGRSELNDLLVKNQTETNTLVVNNLGIIGKNLGVGGNLAVAGDATINGKLLVKDNSTFNGSILVSGLTTLGRIIGGSASLDSLNVSGNTTFNTVQVNRLSSGSASVTGLYSSAQAVFSGLPFGSGVGQGSVYINPGSANTTDTLLGLAVAGATKFRIDGAGNIFGSALDVASGSLTAGAASLSSSFTSGNSIVGNNLTVYGNGIFDNDVTLGSSSSDSLNINSNSNLNGQANFNGPSIFNNVVSITGNNTLTVGGVTTLNGAGIFNGSNTFNGNNVFNGTVLNNNSVILSGANILTVGGTANLQGNVILGDNSTQDSISFNGLVSTNIIPNSNVSRDLGSTSFYWRKLFVNELFANSVSAPAATIAGTTSSDFIINSDNATNDTEDMSLAFFRGIGGAPNAVVSWNSVAKRFELNNKVFIQDVTPGTGATSFTLKAGANQTGTNLLAIQSNAGADLLHVDGSGNLIVSATGNSTFAGNVGIGTTSPASVLHVVGAGSSGNLSQFIYNGSGNGAAALFASSQGTGATSITNYAIYGSATAVGTSSTNIGGYFTASGNTNNYALITGAGNVGVGSTTPQSRLQVTGISNSSTGGAGNGIFELSTGTGVSTDNRLQFGIVDGSYAWLQSIKPGTVYQNLVLNPNAGNVGIGTTAPWEKLQVSNGAIVAGSQNGTNGSLILAGQYNGANDYLNTFGSQYSSGASVIGFGVKPRPNAAGYVSSTSVNTSRAALEVGNSTGSINGFQFLTAGIQTTAQDTVLAMNPVVTILNNGNVGIGITNPGSKLTVAGGDITIDNNQSLRFKDLSGIAQVLLNFSPTNQIRVGDFSNSFQTLLSGNTLAMFTGAGPVERMRIDSSGNVGIGTTTPGTYQLSVVGNSLFSTSGSLRVANSSGKTLRLRTDDTSKIIIDASNSAETAYAPLQFSGSTLSLFGNNGTGVFIDSVGNVGIGTSVIGTNNRLIVNAYSTVDNLATTQINMNAATNKGLVVQGFSGQSADLQQWQNSGGTALNKIVSDGTMVFSTGIGNIEWASGRLGPQSGTGIRGNISTLALGDTYANGLSVTRRDSGLAPTVSIASFPVTVGTAPAALAIQPSSASDIATIIRGAASQAADLLQIQNSSATVLAKIDATGNVGIGTTSPLTKLHVVAPTASGNGIAIFESDGVSTQDATVLIKANNINQNARLSIQTDTGTNVPSVVLQDGTSLNFSLVGLERGTSTVLGGVRNDLIFANVTDGRAILFGTKNSGTLAERVRITASGNVGIGSANPIYKLQVTGASDDWIAKFTNTQGAASNPGRGLVVEGGDATVATHRAFEVRDKDGNAKLTVLSGGNVGIGTTSPVFNLHVYSSTGSPIARVEAAATDQFAGVQVRAGGNYQAALYQAGPSVVQTDLISIPASTSLSTGVQNTGGFSLISSEPNAPIRFATGGSATTNERVRITSTGNVGIGTTSPGATFQVNGGASSKTALFKANASSPGNIIEAQAASGALLFELNVNQVGIDIAGSAAAPSLYVAYTNTGLFSPSANALAVVTNGSERIRVDNAGNVGIGTTGPSNKLSVAGTANFSGHIAVGADATVDQNLIEYDGSSNTAKSVQNIKETFTDTSPYALQGQDVDVTFNPSGPSSVIRMIGTRGIARTAGSQTLAGNLVGAYNLGIHNSTATLNGNFGEAGFAMNAGIGTVTAQFGVAGASYNLSTGVLTASYGGHFQVLNNSTGTITDGYGVKISSASNSGTFTNNYGLYVQDQSAVGSTNSYNLYSAGANSKNYFEGKLGIGTVPTIAQLQISNTVAGQRGIYVLDNPSVGANTTQYDAGSYIQTFQNVATGVTNSGYSMGSHAEGYLAGAGTLLESYGGRFDSGVHGTGTGTVTTAYGARLRVLNQGTGSTITTGYGLYIDPVQATNKYGIYQAGATDNNYLAGRLNIGVSTNTSMLGIPNQLTISSDDIFTNAPSILSSLAAAIGSSSFSGVRSRGTHAAPTAVQDGDGIVNFAGTSYNGSSYQTTGIIQFAVDGTVTSGQRPPTRLQIYTNSANASATERLRINSSGNVGIGNTNPGERLSVIGASNTYSERITNAGGTGVNFGTLIQAGTNTSDYSLSVQNSAGTNYLNVRGDGNVGVGTAAPGSKLDVSGDLKVSSNIGIGTSPAASAAITLQTGDGSSNVVERYNNTSGTNEGIIGVIGGNGNYVNTGSTNDFFVRATNNLLFSTNSAGTERLRIDTSGHVLINSSITLGTNSNFGVLQIANGDDAVVLKRNTDTSPTGSFLRMQNAAGTTDLASIDITGKLTVKDLVITGGGITLPLANKATAYTITASDSVVTADSTSGAFTVTLPTAVGITGREYTIKRINSSANAVTVGTTSSQTIDGATTYSLGAQWKFIKVISDGSNWLIVSSN